VGQFTGLKEGCGELYTLDAMDKKHEDVGGVAQIDKTSVFQEGKVACTVHGLQVVHGGKES
jgi:hypothetical protein